MSTESGLAPYSYTTCRQWEPDSDGMCDRCGHGPAAHMRDLSASWGGFGTIDAWRVRRDNGSPTLHVVGERDGTEVFRLDIGVAMLRGLLAETDGPA